MAKLLLEHQVETTESEASWPHTMRTRENYHGVSGLFPARKNLVRKAGPATCTCMAGEQRGCRAPTIRRPTLYFGQPVIPGLTSTAMCALGMTCIQTAY